MNLAVIKSWAQAHAPELLLGTGIVAGLGATVAGCIATVKTDDILIRHKALVDVIKGRLEKEEISQEEYKKDLTKQYINTSLSLGATWGPCAGLTAISIIAPCVGYNILNKRCLKYSTALTLISTTFDKYRKEVVIDQGEEKDAYYISGGASKKLIEKGKELPKLAKSHTKEDLNLDKSSLAPVINPNNKYGVFHYLFCEDSVDWKRFSDVPGANLAALLAQQELFQIKFDDEGFIPLEAVFSNLGLDKTILFNEAAEGRHYGWVRKGYASDGLADDRIDFGIYTNDVNHELFREGVTNEVLLIFNCRLIDDETYRKLARG